MKCVSLLGFSTTGKSSILRDFNQYRSDIDVLDSDEQISKEENGHIYCVFLRYREGQNTNPSLFTIERREREFLMEITPTTRPLLLACGPFLPIREPEWTDFVGRIKPICFYLQKSAEEVLRGLLERRARHKQDPQLSADPGFGCWDQGITTEFRDGRWIEIDHETALENIRRNMANILPFYERYSAQIFTWQERQTETGRDRLYQAIREQLDV